MRGYKIGDISSRLGLVAQISKSRPEAYRSPEDEQQEARNLQIAREIYRHCADMVVFESDELDENLASLAD
jgi:hypothetical protein